MSEDEAMEKRFFSFIEASIKLQSYGWNITKEEFDKKLLSSERVPEIQSGTEFRIAIACESIARGMVGLAKSMRDMVATQKKQLKLFEKCLAELKAKEDRESC
jgi:hypothetical protein